MKLFKLSARQVAAEPAHEFFTNLKIHGYILDRKRLEMKDHGRRTN